MSSRAQSGIDDTVPAELHPLTAQRIGQYEVLLELAHGGMGRVYLARAVGEAAGIGGFERLVAIKRMHAHLLPDVDAVQRFLEEARVAARIHHANVVGIHQVGSDESGHFLVQDYVEGDNLAGLIDQAALQRTRLPVPIVLRIAADALAGLHAVHEATDRDGRPLGILHRDIATQNLLIGRDGVTRVADFGIAKHAMSSIVTDAMYLQGRVLYMPPEYLLREPVDRRVDIYAFGMTLWIALTGDAPWPEASDAQVMHHATTKGIPPLSSSGLDIAPAVEAIIARACSREKNQRFATARAMLQAIEAVGRDTGWLASHGEVAELVERLAGKSLARRREAIAARRGAVSPLATPRAEEPTFRYASATGGSPTPTVTTTAAGLPKRMSGAALATITALVLLAAVAAGFAMRKRPEDPARDAAAAQTASAAAAQVPNATATATATSTSAPAAPTDSPSAAASAGATAPGRVRAPRGTPEPTGVPKTISTVNPYR